MRGARLPVAAGVAVIALIAAGAVLGATTRTAKTIRGTARANTLRGTAAADAIYGLGGNDKLYGGAGNDKLYGGGGGDLLVAGPGADVLSCGPGNDTAVGDAKDKAGVDCEHVRGIPKTGGGGSKPPPAVCSNGKDDDGDGLTDFPNDPGCESALDPDETDDQPPPPPAKHAQPGTYCGYSDQGPGLCLTTGSDGTDLTTFQTQSIIDCSPASRWTWTITISRPLLLDDTLSFDYESSSTGGSTADGTVTNIALVYFVKGTFTEDGKASGTLAISQMSYDYQGTHFTCTQGAVGWHVDRQG